MAIHPDVGRTITEEHRDSQAKCPVDSFAPNTSEIFIRVNTSPSEKSSVASLLLSAQLPGYTLWAGHSSWRNSYLTYHLW